MIIDNLKFIEERISKAQLKSPYGQQVQLIAVSKTHPAQAVKEAYDAGIRDFGENKVQELTEKIPVLPKDIRWHLIGHLQRNKVKYIIDKVYLIHSVDSFRLAEEIEAQAAKKDVSVNVLIQVNISLEESKFGINKEEVFELVRAISKFQHVNVLGLMTIAPEEADAENCRYVFTELKNLSIDIEALNIDNIRMDFLSMGMSGDFEVAIEEGSNLVRVGTAIFGKRDYNK